MAVSSFCDPVCQVTVVREKDQPAGVLVKPSDRVYTLSVVQKIDDIIRITAVRSAFDPLRLIAREKDVLLLLLRFRSRNDHLLTRQNTIAGLRFHSVDRNLSRFDQPVGLTP